MGHLNDALTLAASVTCAYLAYALYWDKKPQLAKLPPPAADVADLIGNTEVVEIKSLSRYTKCRIYAKLELNNPGGSAKDRVALAIIRAHEQTGQLAPNRGDVIFEGTSGSTGISIAMLANALGYKAHICLPNDTSPQKIALLESYGAEVEPVPPASIVDPNQYTNAAAAAAKAINNNPDDPRRAIFADQFESDYNWRVHYATTGPEIALQVPSVDVFVSGSGTGGTIAGVGRYLKHHHNPRTTVVLADPQGSGLANRVNYGVMYDTVEREGTRRRHQVDTVVEGIGLNRLTHNFSLAEPIIDDAVRVKDEAAVAMAKWLCTNDGFFWGSSSCVNAVAAVETALRLGPGHTIVTIACDSGSRHLSKFYRDAAKANPTSVADILDLNK
ncbi:hypothetical protein DIURU_001422 [Diutina rugosa]|uniref:Tryptophan synthase beta chain-like PALP domain-containing protein n=1 Tax=Diutina rugosa TaxID=5481 RepID=A0A642UUE9_DIURU|nr:uncharacterized protein DIURU_001422 [Diutina rugosa]KAA8905619.1 hypothetical protein DIURU_001422 [Diutina rugosa]